MTITRLHRISPCSLLAGLSITLLTSGAAFAQGMSLNGQCWSELRAQLRGENCRKPQEQDSNSPCFISMKTQGNWAYGQVEECVNAGGPKKWLASKGKR